MRSTNTEENGRGDSNARGDSLDTVGWVFTFAVWQLAHPEMNFHRNVDIPGHQFSFCMW